MEVNKVDFFSDNTRHLSTNYDYNKDGTVDIQDYNFALLSLEDDDPDNDVELSKDELKAVFADLIKEDDKVNPDNVNVNKDNISQLSQNLLDNAAKTIADPSKAKDFAELQEIGKNLSRTIKRCTKLLPFLNQQMEIYNQQLKDISEEKAEKEEEYAELEGTVNQKNDQLAEKMTSAMNQSEHVTEEMRKNTSNIISDCVERYKNGEFEGQDLYSVITENLAKDNSCAFSVSALNSLISDCGSLGSEIKALCGDIEDLVSEIRDVTQKFNNTTTMMNALKANRNGVLDVSNKASAEYQKGYERRQELRKEISSQFGSGTAGLKAFLNSEMSTSIPFSDAYAIMAEIGKDTGIRFTDGNIIMPNFIYMESESEITDEERAQMAEFNEISDLVNSKYASSDKTKTSAANDDADDDWDDFGDEDWDDFGDEDFDFGDEDDPDVDDDGEVNVGDGDVDVGDDELDEEEFNTGEPTSLGCCTKSKCCDPISFNKGNTSYHFVSDNDKDGTFDGASEFLGAKNGWEEMKAYDANGDGKINGKELDELKLVSVNNDNGQYNFMSASEAGIQEIDLSSYNKENSKQSDGDMLKGTYELKMADGSVIKGEQTDDSSKNIENRYSALFGAQIDDLSEDYEDNPFMDEFIETVDTAVMKSQTDRDFAGLKRTSENNIVSVNKDGDSDARVSSDKTSREVKAQKAKEEAEKEKAEKEKKAE